MKDQIHFLLFVILFFSLQTVAQYKITTVDVFHILQGRDKKIVFSTQNPIFYSIESANGQVSFQKSLNGIVFWIKRIRSNETIYLLGDLMSKRIKIKYFLKKSGNTYSSLDVDRCSQEKSTASLDDLISIGSFGSGKAIFQACNENTAMIDSNLSESVRQSLRRLEICQKGERSPVFNILKEELISLGNDIKTKQENSKLQFKCDDNIKSCAEYSDLRDQTSNSTKLISLNLSCNRHRSSDGKMNSKEIKKSICHEIAHSASIPDDEQSHKLIDSVCAFDEKCDEVLFNFSSESDKNSFNNVQESADRFATLTPPPNLDKAQQVAHDVTTLNPSTTTSRTVSEAQNPAVTKYFSNAEASLAPAANWAFQLADYVAPAADVKPRSTSLASVSSDRGTGAAIRDTHLTFKDTPTSKIDPSAAAIKSPSTDGPTMLSATSTVAGGTGLSKASVSASSSAGAGDTGGSGGGASASAAGPVRKLAQAGDSGSPSSIPGSASANTSSEAGRPGRSTDVVLSPTEQLRAASNSVYGSQRLYEDLKAKPDLRSNFQSSLNRAKIIVFGPGIGTIGYHDKDSASAIYEYRTSGGRPRFVQIK